MTRASQAMVSGLRHRSQGPAPLLRVRNLTKRFAHPAGAVVAARDVSFDVHRGELVVLGGPAGCGKSTVLRSIVGAEIPDAGTVEVAAGGQGRVALVRAEDVIQQQLRAVTRVLGEGAALVLLDDPLSALAGRARAQLRRDLQALQRDVGFTAVLATRDQIAATELAHRLVVMVDGRVAQLGPPGEVYDEPASRAVASHLGAVNEVRGRVLRAGGRGAGAVLVTPLGEVTGRSGVEGLAPGDDGIALWRPESSRLVPAEPTGANRWPVVVDASLHLGAHTQHAVRSGEQRFLVWQDAGVAAGGHGAWLGVDPAAVRVYPVG